MLTAEQIDAFRRDGFLVGVPVLAAGQAAALRRRLRDRAQAERLLPALATHPAVLSAVGSLLGPDLLIRNVDVFIKGPRSDIQTEWHVDTDVPPEQAEGLINAWIALTPSTRESGCLAYLPARHTLPLAEEPAGKEALGLTRASLAALDLSAAVYGELEAGWMALHAFRTPHRSDGNFTGSPRVGVVVRFVSARASCEAARCRQAFLAAGHPRGWLDRLRRDIPIGWNIQAVPPPGV